MNNILIRKKGNYLEIGGCFFNTKNYKNCTHAINGRTQQERPAITKA
nr:MAG TPA: hypothetical protein [Caudoviricetes sp.]